MNVSGPNGLQEIANPLFAYQFKPLNPTAFIEEPVSSILLPHKVGMSLNAKSPVVYLPRNRSSADESDFPGSVK